MMNRNAQAVVLIASSMLAGCDTLQPFMTGFAEGLSGAGGGPAGQMYVPPLQSISSALPHGGATFDRGLNACVRVLRDANGGVLENDCAIAVSVSFNSPDFPGGDADIGPGGRSFLSAMGIGAHGAVSYAACPKGDYIREADGETSWRSGPFTCVHY
jgi:hypothetical protein